MNIASLVENKKNLKIPEISPGDTVKVSARIVEGGKERIQVFQGVVIQVRPSGAGASFTVRHVAYGIGVERTFPYYSPLVEKVEIVRHGKVRRSKLYYLRNLSGRQARRKIKRVEKKVEAIGGELLEPEPEEVIEPEEVLGKEAEAMAQEQPEAAGEVAAIEEIEVAEEAVAEEAAEVTEEAKAEEPAAEVEEKPEAVAEAMPEEPVAEEVAEVTEEANADEPTAEVEEKPEAMVEQEEEKPKDAKSS